MYCSIKSEKNQILVFFLHKIGFYLLSSISNGCFLSENTYKKSCDQNKSYSLGKNLLLKSGLPKFVGWKVKASEMAKETGHSF